MARAMKHPDDDDGVGPKNKEHAIRKSGRQHATHFGVPTQPPIRKRVFNHTLEAV